MTQIENDDEFMPEIPSIRQGKEIKLNIKESMMKICKPEIDALIENERLIALSKMRAEIAGQMVALTENWGLGHSTIDGVFIPNRCIKELKQLAAKVGGKQ